MKEAEVVHNFKLADQEAYAKRLMLICVNGTFNLMQVGKPCGSDPMAAFETIAEVRTFLSGLKQNDSQSRLD